MSIERVLDTSALLAVFAGEPGADRVRKLLPGSCVSAVNLGETIGKLVEKGMTYANAVRAMRVLGIAVHPHGEAEALAEAELRTYAARRNGIGIADRACLATAKVLGVPAVTSDHTWADAYAGTIQLEFFRPKLRSSK